MQSTLPIDQGFTPELERYYSEAELRAGQTFDEDALRRMRKNGLKFVTVARGRRLYKGQWIRDYLEAQAQ